MLEEFVKLIDEKQSVGIRIDLTKDFPVTFPADKNSQYFRNKKFLLGEIVIAEDLVTFMSQIEDATNSPSKYLRAHFRIEAGDNEHRQILVCAEFHKQKLGHSYFQGVVVDVSWYFKNQAVSEDPEMKDLRRKTAAFLPGGKGKTSLKDILDVPYLQRMQNPFRQGERPVYSAIYDEKNNLICMAIGLSPQKDDLNKFAFRKKISIRVSHYDAAFWIIASDSEELVSDDSPNAVLLDVLASSLTRIANASMLLWSEMQNSENANKMLSENIEQQLLVNNVYNIILEETNSLSAIQTVMKVVGDYMRFDKINIYSGADEMNCFRMRFVWAKSESLPTGEEILHADEFPEMLDSLDYSDIYYTREIVHEFSKFGIKSFLISNLNSGGNRCGMILYENIYEARNISTQDAKIIRSISQIIATVLTRYQVDIELENTTNQLKQLAFNDMVLDIPNRAKLDIDLSEKLFSHGNGYLIMLKITNLRIFNELFGHSYSDSMLQSVTHYLKSLDIGSEENFLYRFSGNVLVIVEKSRTRDGIQSLAEQIVERFQSMWGQNKNEHYLEVGVGIANFPEDGNCCENIYRSASMAMYRAMDYGANSFAFYMPRFELPVKEDYAYGQTLRRLIGEGMDGFFLRYQPIIELSTGKMRMCETYVGWKRENDLLPTTKLIRLAEAMGFDILLDTWVIEKACCLCRKIRDKFDPNFIISVNITARELESGTIISMINNALKKSGLPPNAVSVDIPTQVFSTNYINAAHTTAKLKEIGVCLAIDGFGGDFLMPELLRHSYIDLVKTDFSVFTNVFNEFDRILLAATMELARTVKNGVCVKRIEEPEQMEITKGYPLRYVEGNIFSRPLSESELICSIEKDGADTVWSVEGK